VKLKPKFKSGDKVSTRLGGPAIVKTVEFNESKGEFVYGLSRGGGMIGLLVQALESDLEPHGQYQVFEDLELNQ